MRCSPPSSSHLFPSLTKEGAPAILETSGNPHCHVVLRGGTESGPNFDADAVAAAVQLLVQARLPQRLMIDASHGNSGKDPARQLDVVDAVIRQKRAGDRAIRALMIESHLVGGRQDLGARAALRPERYRCVPGLRRNGGVDPSSGEGSDTAVVSPPYVGFGAGLRSGKNTMLNRIDRVMITAHDAAAVANRWVELLDARIDRRDRVSVLGADRIVVSVGDSEVEILQPVAPGPVARHLAAGGGAFAAGLATRNIHVARRRLAEAGIVPTQIGQQFFVDAGRLGIPGLSIVVSADAERPRVGLMTTLYEVTHLTTDPAGTLLPPSRGCSRSISATSCRSVPNSSATTAR